MKETCGKTSSGKHYWKPKDKVRQCEACGFIDDTYTEETK